VKSPVGTAKPGKMAKTGGNVQVGRKRRKRATGTFGRVDMVKTPARTMENWQNQENVEPVKKSSAAAEKWPFSLP
jgi:hypothetical protein